MAIIAMVLVAGLPASSWAVLGLEGLSYDGSLETSAVRAANEVDFADGQTPNDRHSDVDTRVRVGINMSVTDEVAGRLEFTRTGSRYGRNFAGSAGGANSIADEESNILINNALVALMLWDWNLRIGRQYVGEENDLVWFIGPRSDDILSVDAIDGFDFRRKWDKLGLNVFLGKAQENNAQGNANDINEVSLKNLMLSFMLSEIMRLHVGGIWGSNSNTNATSDSTKLTIYRAGINGGLNENFLTYRAELLMNAGEDLLGGTKTKFKGNALDLGVGVNLPESGAGQIGIGGSFLMASGDDDGDDNDDESFHDLRRVNVLSSDRYYGEIFGRSNVMGTPGLGVDTGAASAAGNNQGPGVTIINLNATFKPAFAPKWWTRLDFYDFSASEDSQTVGGLDTDIGDFGREIDLMFGYRHSDNVGFEGGFAMFTPDDALTGGGTAKDDDVTKWVARMKLAWGGRGGGMTQIDPVAK